MFLVIVKDFLIRQSLQGLLLRAGVTACFYSKVSESSAAIMEEPDALEALIIDYDIDPALCKWLISGVLHLAEKVKILVYSDFPIGEFHEDASRNQNLKIKEKPFILGDILEILQSETRRNNVSLQY